MQLFAWNRVRLLCAYVASFLAFLPSDYCACLSLRLLASCMYVCRTAVDVVMVPIQAGMVRASGHMSHVWYVVSYPTETYEALYVCRSVVQAMCPIAVV
jgi:hypothetical protein